MRWLLEERRDISPGVRDACRSGTETTTPRAGSDSRAGRDVWRTNDGADTAAPCPDSSPSRCRGSPVETVIRLRSKWRPAGRRPTVQPACHVRQCTDGVQRRCSRVQCCDAFFGCCRSSRAAGRNGPLQIQRARGAPVTGAPLVPPHPRVTARYITLRRGQYPCGAQSAATSCVTYRERMQSWEPAMMRAAQASSCMRFGMSDSPQGSGTSKPSPAIRGMMWTW